MSRKVRLAPTLTIIGLALVALCALQVTITGLAVWESVVAIRAVVTIRLQVLLAALALSSLLGTVSGQIEAIAVAWLAHIRLVPVATVRAVVLWRTLVTIDTLRVVLAVDANATSLVVSVNVQRGGVAVNLLVVTALRRVPVAVASCREGQGISI